MLGGAAYQGVKPIINICLFIPGFSLYQIFCVNLAWLSISVMTTYTQYNTLDLLLHILSLSPSRFLVRISKQGTLLMFKWRCRDFARIYKEEPNLSMVWLVPLKPRTKSATIWLASQKNKASINELKLFLCFYFLFCRQTCGINADSFLRKEKKGESKASFSSSIYALAEGSQY